jgi:hypothetical protein
MLRRLGSVVAGMIACQVSMIVSLALGVALMFGLPDQPLLVIAGVGVLLLLPGLAGGGLTGFLSDRHGIAFGATAALLFGLSILLVKLFVAPGLGYPVLQSDLILYPALTAALGVTGALGGALGRRTRRAGPRPSPARSAAPSTAS